MKGLPLFDGEPLAEITPDAAPPRPVLAGGQLFELHPDQQTILAELRAAIRAGARRPIVAAPTGTGKTVIAAHIVAGARAKGNRVAFCVPSIGLIDQTFERFVANGLPAGEMGVMQADHPWRRSRAPIQIATAQTLIRRDLPRADVVVIDEAHIQHTVYDRWMDGHQDRSGPLFIGLSATPWSRGLGRRYDALVRPVTLSQLIGAGRLAPFRVLAPSHPDLQGVKIVAGDYHEGQLATRMNRPRLVADIVDTWLAKGRGRPTLCFATGRAHAKSIYEAFAKAGVTAAYVDADTPREEREVIGRRLAAGAVEVVVNIGTLTTGIDWDVRCIILARPTKSEILFVQIVGRGLRTAAGKDHCLILDHSDTHQRLGFVTDIDHAELDMGEKGKASKREKPERQMPAPRACPSCEALMPATSTVCGHCGAVATPSHNVETVNGELIQFAGRSAAPKGTKGPTLVEQLQAQGPQAVHAQLEAMRLERGRASGWVANTYREIFGQWPAGRLASLPPVDPSPALVAYVRWKAIRYAKGMAKRGAVYATAH